jgi:hypothetical protein
VVKLFFLITVGGGIVGVSTALSLLCLVKTLVRLNYALHKLMTHYILLAKLNLAHALHAVKYAQRLYQARLR